MILLVLGLAAFFAVHLVPAVPRLRAGLIGQFGERGYKGVFSLLSLATLGFLVWAYGQAPLVEIWTPPPWMRLVAMIAMLIALIVLMGAFFPGAIKQRLKHPMLVAIKIWAIVHLLANGDLAGILLFGGFLAYAVVSRIAARGRDEHMPVSPARAGWRNDLIAVVAGLALYAAFIGFLHEHLIGVSLSE